MKYFIVLVCLMTITAVYCQNSKDSKKKSNKNEICKKQLKVNMFDCCPSIAGAFNSVYEQCKNNCTIEKEGCGFCTECLLNNTKIVGADGKISEESFKKLWESSSFSDAAGEVITACIANATAIANAKNSPKCKRPGSQCYNSDVFWCTMKNLYLQCPDVDTKADCTSLTENVTNCQFKRKDAKECMKFTKDQKCKGKQDSNKQKKN